MLNEVPNAVKDAKQAIKDSKEVLQNPPKIVDGNWYIYDYANDTYQDSGINAVGDAFTIVKTYSSVQAMEDDYNNPEVKKGQFVMIARKRTIPRSSYPVSPVNPCLQCR